MYPDPLICKQSLRHFCTLSPLVAGSINWTWFKCYFWLGCKLWKANKWCGKGQSFFYLSQLLSPGVANSSLVFVWGGAELCRSTCLKPETLHDFRLSQMKDWHRETIMAISVTVATNPWSCVLQWERFKVLWPKIAYDTAWSPHSVFAGTIHVYWPTNKNPTWNQCDMALKHNTAYLKLLCLPLSPLALFFSTYKNNN